MSLTDWERNGWVTRHETSPNEIRDLLQVVERDLADSGTEGLSARKKRNPTGYERIGLVSDADADAMHALAARLRDDVLAWLTRRHAGLMRKGSEMTAECAVSVL